MHLRLRPGRNRLVPILDAEDAQLSAFRARLKHFRKLGIPAKNPGKGTRLRYSESDLFQLLVALELSEFDVDPVLIVKIIQRHWTLGSGFGRPLGKPVSIPPTTALPSFAHASCLRVWARERSCRAP